MFDRLKELALVRGHALAAMPVSRLVDIRRNFDGDRVKDFDFGPWDDLGFEGRSVIIAAFTSLPKTATFTTEGGEKKVVIPPGFIGSGQGKVIFDYLSAALGEGGLHIAMGKRLPAKAIAACTGLGVYGRNNVIYVDGKGSFCSLALYMTDMDSSDEPFDAGAMLRRSHVCARCGDCVDKCPTGSLSHDRQTVDMDTCLCFINESPGDFPEWVKLEWHNALIGCMACQSHCPMNAPYTTDMECVADFDDAQTRAILNGAPAKGLDFGRFNDLIPRNLSVLLSAEKGPRWS